MPFKSEKQKRWMYTNEPELAKKWSKKKKTETWGYTEHPEDVEVKKLTKEDIKNLVKKYGIKRVKESIYAVMGKTRPDGYREPENPTFKYDSEKINESHSICLIEKKVGLKEEIDPVKMIKLYAPIVKGTMNNMVVAINKDDYKKLKKFHQQFNFYTKKVSEFAEEFIN